jgi:hypothetical protein
VTSAIETVLKDRAIDLRPLFAAASNRLRVLFLAVVVSFSASIVYTDVQTYNSEQTPRTGFLDSNDYLSMYFGGAGTGIRAYRPLVPFLARAIPPLPHALFGQQHTFDRFSIAAAKFGVVNFLFLVGACIALAVLQRGFGLTRGQAFLGVLLFLSSETVVRGAGLPMVDTAFFFFFLLALVAVQRDNTWLYFWSLLVGVLAKELVLLAAPMVLLSLLPWRRKIQLLALTTPAVGAYAIVRVASGAPTDAYVTGQVLGFVPQELAAFASLNGFLNLCTAFGIAWVPAIYAFFRCDLPPLLGRWSWLLPMVFLGVVLGAGNPGRSVFSAFPVVEPLAAIGLSTWVARARDELPRSGVARDGLIED